MILGLQFYQAKSQLQTGFEVTRNTCTVDPFVNDYSIRVF